jgi:hypothetical protein
LLDVKLEITQNLGRQNGLWNLPGAQSKRLDGGANGDAIGIAAIQKFFIETAYQRTAPDEWHAKTNTFLFGKPENLNRKGQAAPFKRFEQRHGQGHAENPIVGAGVWNRVEMRANQQPRRIRGGAGI